MFRTIHLLAFGLLLLIGNKQVKAQSISGPPESCAGENFKNLFFVTGGSGCGSPVVTSASSWSVSPSAGVIIEELLPAENFNAVRMSFSNPGNYTIMAAYTCTNGSPGTAQLQGDPMAQFVVHSVTVPSVTIAISSSNQNICSGSIVFTASPENAGNTPEFRWLKNGVLFDNESNKTLTLWAGRVNHNDQIAARVTSSNACANPVAVTSSAIAVPKNSTRAIPLQQNLEFCEFETPVLSAPLSDVRLTYRWYTENEQLLGESQTFVLPEILEGTYHFKAKFIDDFTCVAPDYTNIQLSIIKSCDSKLNWIESKSYSYDDGGNAKEIAASKSYYDNGGAVLQRQSKSYSADAILTSASLKDEAGRYLVSTLPAPVATEEFQYERNFVKTVDGKRYTHEHFDEPVGNAPGTVGAYYGPNPNGIPVSGFPFTRATLAKDGSGSVIKTADVGEQHREGSGKEVWSATFPVFSELDEYKVIRHSLLATDFFNINFKNGSMYPWESFTNGVSPTARFQWAWDGVVRANGLSGTANTDMIGQRRAQAKWPEGDYVVKISVANYSTLGIAPLQSGLNIWSSNAPNSSVSSVSYVGDGVVPVGQSKDLTVSFHLSQECEYILFSFYKQGPSSDYSADIRISAIDILTHDNIPQSSSSSSGLLSAIQSVNKDQNGLFQISMTDRAGNQLMSAIGGSATNFSKEVNNYVKASSDPSSPDYRPLTYFYLLHEQTVTITGYPGADYVVEDLFTGQAYNPNAVGDSDWEPGFYRIVLKSGFLILSYKHYLKHEAYSIFDDAGKLVTTISPNGVNQMKQDISFDAIDKTIQKYDHRGWMTSIREADAGLTEFRYRVDGKIRYSQNALQRQNAAAAQPNTGKFSYTNYDEIGRPIESGEYIGTSKNFPTTIEDVENNLLYSTDPLEVTARNATLFDFPAGPIPNLPTTFTQEYLRGAVSSTENANIKTWYSYDEFGRVTWLAQKPMRLNRTFVTKYTYDFIGNVTQVHNCSYVGGVPMDQFYHHYEYDEDNRLWKAYTSTDGSNKKLRATYDYYLHGPLKRIELGDKLQGIDFVYNIHGWLTQINHPDNAQDPGGDGSPGDNAGVRPDVFGMVLDYYESDLNNLYTASTFSPNRMKDLHGLPVANTPAYAANHQPLIRFNDFYSYDPSEVSIDSKEHSAENPKYRTMLSELHNNR
jgi:hypothetical protein